MDKLGEIWIAGQKLMMHYNGETWSVIGDVIQSSSNYKKGSIWVYSDDRLAYVDYYGAVRVVRLADLGPSVRTTHFVALSDEPNEWLWIANRQKRKMGITHQDQGHVDYTQRDDEYAHGDTVHYDQPVDHEDTTGSHSDGPVEFEVISYVDSGFFWGSQKSHTDHPGTPRENHWDWSDTFEYNDAVGEYGDITNHWYHADSSHADTHSDTPGSFKNHWDWSDFWIYEDATGSYGDISYRDYHADNSHANMHSNTPGRFYNHWDWSDFYLYEDATGSYGDITYEEYYADNSHANMHSNTPGTFWSTPGHDDYSDWSDTPRPYIDWNDHYYDYGDWSDSPRPHSDWPDQIWMDVWSYESDFHLFEDATGSHGDIPYRSDFWSDYGDWSDTPRPHVDWSDNWPWHNNWSDTADPHQDWGDRVPHSQHSDHSNMHEDSPMSGYQDHNDHSNVHEDSPMSGHDDHSDHSNIHEDSPRSGGYHDHADEHANFTAPEVLIFDWYNHQDWSDYVQRDYTDHSDYSDSPHGDSPRLEHSDK